MFSGWGNGKVARTSFAVGLDQVQDQAAIGAAKG